MNDNATRKKRKKIHRKPGRKQCESNPRFFLTLISASCVLNAAEVSLVPDADGVVHLGEHQAGCLVVVEGGHAARHSSEVLQAPGVRCSR